MSITIRRARPGEAGLVLSFVRELAQYEKLLHEVEATEADIDQALLRIKEGRYGICARCSQPIDERRLEALPTARYDAACQTAIESANGEEDLPTL